jgi:hypothetical protein
MQAAAAAEHDLVIQPEQQQVVALLDKYQQTQVTQLLI